jgi:hypothetical protein
VIAPRPTRRTTIPPGTVTTVTERVVRLPPPNTNGNGHGPARSATGTNARLATRVRRHPWRFAVVAAGLLLAANLLWLAGHTADTTDKTKTFPNAVSSVQPGNGSLVSPQSPVSVDLRDDLTGVLVVDGVQIPENELSRIVPLGELSFRPGKGQVFTRLQAGTHTASVVYWPQTKSRADGTDTFTWTFRTG